MSNKLDEIDFSKNTTRDVIITFRVTKEERELIHAEATKRGVSASKLVYIVMMNSLK